MKSIHVLLIEDNEGDIVLITEALKEGDISNTLSVVKDGWEAIQFLNKTGKYSEVQSPDLILLDINLPKMNGHKVLQYIKKSKVLKRIPVIMLTTSSDETDVLKAYENHSNCYITKPVDIHTFLEVVTCIEKYWVSVVQLPVLKG